MFYDKHKTMSINAKQKRPPGRPPTGITPMVGVRLGKDLRREVHKWAGRQSGKITLSEALRRLVELGLKAKIPKRQL